MLKESMTPQTDSLALAIHLYDALENRLVVGRTISGCLPSNLDFAKIVAALDMESLLIAEDSTSRTIEFSLPHTLNNFFYISLEELLVNPARRIHPPARFYVAELGYLYEGQTTPPPALQTYLRAADLFRLLHSVADHCNESDRTLVFWEKGKVILNSEYSGDELSVTLEVAELRTEFFKSTIHSKQKHTIIRMALLEEFSGCNTVRLGDLLKHFDAFTRRILSSYQLYVAEFSFEKIKAEIEKEKLEFTTKLNKVFSDIQNQLLAIPVAVVLIGGQMERANEWTLKNSLIWAGAFFFCILMNLLIRNQRNTLIAIRHEIDQQWQQIRGKHSSVADRFSASYQQLELRHLHQERLIRTISGMVAFSLAVATSLFIHYSVAEPTAISAAYMSAAVFIAGLIFILLRWFKLHKA